VASNWKSTTHTAFGASATGTVPAVEAPRRFAPAALRHPRGPHRARAAESCG
jgi:hypothetical protein